MLTSFQFVPISITCSQVLRKFYFKELGLYLREAMFESNRVKLLILLALFYCVIYLVLFKTIFMMRYFEIGRKIIFWCSGDRKSFSRHFWPIVLKIVVHDYINIFKTHQWNSRFSLTTKWSIVVEINISDVLHSYLETDSQPIKLKF